MNEPFLLPDNSLIATAYFDTRFKLGLPLSELPESFSIITAHATNGEDLTIEYNFNASEAFRDELQLRGKFLGAITGYSPITQHSEVGYAATLEFEEACNIGVRFKQDWIYYVSSGTLFVSYCDHRPSSKPITQFSKRADPEPETGKQIC